MKKLLIVGGSGLIGSACIKRGLKKNYKIFSLSLKKNPRIKNVNCYHFDYSSFKNFKNIDNNFDYIINAGGYFLKKVGNFKKLDKHFLGLKNIINFCDKKKLKKIIHIGSSLEYEGLNSPLREEMLCDPKSYYGKIKLQCTKYCQLMFKKKKIPITVIRPFSIFSENQTKGLIYHLIQSISQTNKLKTKNIPETIDLIHLDDLIDAIFSLLNSNNTNGKVLNIGSGSPTKVIKIIKFIYKARKLSFNDNIINNFRFKKGEFYPDIKKISKFIRWKKKKNLFINLNRIAKNFNITA